MSPSHEKWRIPSFQKCQTSSKCICPETGKHLRHWIERENRPRKPPIPASPPDRVKGSPSFLQGMASPRRSTLSHTLESLTTPKTFWKLEPLQLLTYPLNVETLKLDKSSLNMLELKCRTIPAWSVESKGIEHLASKAVPNFDILGCTFSRRRETQTKKGPYYWYTVYTCSVISVIKKEKVMPSYSFDEKCYPENPNDSWITPGWTLSLQTGGKMSPLTLAISPSSFQSHPFCIWYKQEE